MSSGGMDTEVRQRPLRILLLPPDHLRAVLLLSAVSDMAPLLPELPELPERASGWVFLHGTAFP